MEKEQEQLKKMIEESEEKIRMYEHALHEQKIIRDLAVKALNESWIKNF